MKSHAATATASGILVLTLAGCWSERTSPEPRDEAPHNATEEHGTTHEAAASQLIVSTEPSEVAAGEAVELRMMIHTSAGAMVDEFETIHEKRVHLIIVRDDLGTFAHIHPDIDRAGNLSAEYSFPTGGRYLLYADHKPAGQPQSTARGELDVRGDPPAAVELKPNVPGHVSGEELSATVSISHTEEETAVTFDVTDSTGQPVDDLEPYLGAMGHLVILSEDGEEFVHAHPLEGSEADAGRVAFAAHFMGRGLYKGWGQFQRDGDVQTIPFVLEVE